MAKEWKHLELANNKSHKSSKWARQVLSYTLEGKWRILIGKQLSSQRDNSSCKPHSFRQGLIIRSIATLLLWIANRNNHPKPRLLQILSMLDKHTRHESRRLSRCLINREPSLRTVFNSMDCLVKALKLSICKPPKLNSPTQMLVIDWENRLVRLSRIEILLNLASTRRIK